MKVLVVLCAVVACGLAKPYSGYSAPGAYSYSSVVSVSKPVVYAAPANFAYAAPAPQVYAAPAAQVYAAPAAVAVPAPAPVAYPAPAPVAYAAAPAPVVYAAPAPVAVPAPAPAVVAAPAPVAYAAPAVVSAPVAVAPKSQYHAQNELGEASYGHAEPGQTHNAVQDAHGNKVGSFSYVNPDGHVLRTDYVADAGGYRVASNNLPAAPIVAPIDTPEVTAAKANFFHEYAARAAGHARRRRSAVLVQTPASTSPLAYAAPAPLAYAPAPVAYAAPAPLAYAAPAPLAYAAPAHLAYPAPAPVAPLAYAAPYAYAAPAVRHATLTTVVNNPGHAVSYRVD